MRVEQVMFRSGPVRCAADLYLPDGSDDRAPAPAVVMGHSVVMVKEALGPHAEHLALAGFVVLAVDWRTVGSSEGEPRCQWIPQWQVEDLRAGVSHLRGRPEVDPERIGLWGHSPAADDPKLAGYIAQSEELFPTFRNQITLASMEQVLLWAPVRVIHRLAPTPLLRPEYRAAAGAREAS
jgi:predicted alpha/beta hydrolase